MAGGWTAFAGCQAHRCVPLQDIARLARALTRAYEKQGSAYRSITTHNWTARMLMADGGVLQNAADWRFGANGEDARGPEGGVLWRAAARGGGESAATLAV